MDANSKIVAEYLIEFFNKIFPEKKFITHRHNGKWMVKMIYCLHSRDVAYYSDHTLQWEVVNTESIDLKFEDEIVQAIRNVKY